MSPPLEKEPLRVSTNTSIWHRTVDGGQKRGRKKFNIRHPCYLAQYQRSTNTGIIFLGTSSTPVNRQRFATIHPRTPEHPSLPLGSVGTNPLFSFKKETYLNFSHPLRVQFAYILDRPFPHFEIDGVPYYNREPPRVSITKFVTQPSQVPVTFNDGLEAAVVLDDESEQKFWRFHMEYHRKRPKDYSGGGAGPDDDSGGGGEPHDDSKGPNDDSSRTRPNDGQGDVGATSSNVGGGFRVHKVGDVPWGQVGNQRIGIDIPLVIEDIYSDEEMDLEELEMNSNANNAPWGRVGDKRIGIDIPLVIEDIYSNEEMDLIEESQKQDVGTNVDKPESSSSIGITTRPNPSDKDGSQSHTISKPCFFIDVSGRNYLLEYNHEAKEWRWMQNVFERKYGGASIEGLLYERSHSLFLDESPRRRIFNWHTKDYIVLPPPPNEPFSWEVPIVGMIVDTSMRPYAFRVIEDSGKGIIIYDSKTHSWTHLPSVSPRGSRNRFEPGSADMASCKDIVFIIDDHNRIVLYDTKEGKWDYTWIPKEHVDWEVRGLGSWGDRVFSCTVTFPLTIEIQELVDVAKREWKKFDAMPEEMYSLLRNGADPYPFTIDVSYCSEYFLIWASFRLQSGRFVLYNLARKEWETFEAPLPPSSYWTMMNPKLTDKGRDTQATSMTSDKTKAVSDSAWE